MAQGDAFLLIFAIDSMSSWTHLKELRSKIVREKDDDENIPMVIVGNKRDLEQDREVPLNITVDYCQKVNCPLIETSAKTALNVNESFRLLMEQVEEKRQNLFSGSKILQDTESIRTNDKSCCIQ
jgi:GTPase SAR1 family protein